MGLLAELKRRKVFRVGAAYLIVAWLAVQAASIGFPAFEAPPWVLRVFILVLFIGFPVAVVMAWVLEVTPEGLRVEAPAMGTKRVLAGAALLSGLAVLWYFVGQPAVRREQAEATAGAPAPIAQASGKSIAVLPFADLSPTKDQEYFSDGIAEEILNALAQVKDLKVAGRTSSFHFKGKNEDLRSIGKALGVAHVLEGSVRKQGERVRITAQLVKVDDGFHLWSETYDGTLDDVFVLQERIARAITGELKVLLQGGQRERLVPVATRNPEAYALFLQSNATFNRRDGSRWLDAIGALEKAIALDHGFARAHARLASMHALAPGYFPGDAAAHTAECEDHARKATALDPALAEPHAALGVSLRNQRRFTEAFDALERALALDPGDVNANFWSGTLRATTGYRREADALLDRVLALDPLMPNALAWRADGHVIEGDLDRAEALLRRSADLGLAHVGLSMSIVAEKRGRRNEASSWLIEGIRPFAGDLGPGAAEALVRGVYGDERDRAAALRVMETYLAGRPRTISGVVPFILIRMGEAGRAFELLADRPCGNEAAVFNTLFGPEGREALARPDLPDFLRRSGFAALWDRRGPPDMCRREGGDWRCGRVHP